MLTPESSFLINRKYVDITSEEFALTRLCLGFLTLPSLKDGLSESEVKHFISKGYYSFLDYAVCYWADHLEKWVQLAKQTRPNGIVDNSLRKFLGHFWSKVERPLPIPKDLRIKFLAFSSCDYFESLLQAIQIWKGFEILHDTTPENAVSLDLLERISYVRRILEDDSSSFSGDDALRKDISAIYGQNLFKCPLIGCPFFSQGFPTKLLRDQHAERHNRSFFCNLDDCSFGRLGFSTSQDLERHMAKSHGTDLSLLQRDEEAVSPSEISTVSAAPSIFSLSSASTFPSRHSEEVLWLASEQFVSLLVNDDVLKPLFPIAIGNGKIGPERFVRNFRRLLKIFARDLKIEAQQPLHKLAASFVESQATYVAQSIGKRYNLEYQKTTTVTRWHSPEAEGSKEERMEQFLQDQVSQWSLQTREEGSKATGQDLNQEASQTSPNHRPESDTEDLSSEDGEPHDHEGLRSLEPVRQFVIASYAYGKLRGNFKEFVQSSSNDKPQPKRTSRGALYWGRFHSWLRTVTRRPLRQGYQRITWTCVSHINSFLHHHLEVTISRAAVKLCMPMLKNSVLVQRERYKQG
jgi:hypothetical protein